MSEIQTVMLVDDDPNIRQLARLSLERLGGWKVILAASGLDALTLLEQEKPDLILLDVSMPGLDGPATLTRIKQTAHTRVPVILLTAGLQGDEVARCLSSGALGIIAKPFDPLKLAADIKALLAVEPQ